MCLRKLFPSYNDKQLKKLRKIADKVDALADIYAAKTDEELRACTDIFKSRLADGETLDDILPEAFATVREAATRALGLRPYYVQIIGGIVLHQGRIAEMSTGEGKTLVSTMPVYLNALTGKGVHVVTVNEYLASRDATWMGKVHRFLGLTVGVISTKQPLQDKQRAYACDITYGTNSEFGFDYLRDNGARSVGDLVQRGLNFAVVDEVDSVLIDEARTPLIISARGEDSSKLYYDADSFVRRLTAEQHFEVDEKEKTVRLTDEGVEKAESYFNIDLSTEAAGEFLHYIQQALKARNLMERDRDYIVRDGQVLIVDEYTGRVLDGRRFSDGLHQAIEAKERLQIQSESKTIATITYQNLFRLYHKLSGMTGTAKTEEVEFRNVYGLDVVTVPTNVPCRRIDENDMLYKNEAGKMNAILADVTDCYERGQPVLIGTVSVESSEKFDAMLNKARIPHNVLNAKHHEKEAMIVAQAGRYKAVTIATNMAGRGTDIQLGGNADYLAKEVMEDEYLKIAIAYKDKNDTPLQARLKAIFAARYAYFNSLERKDKERFLGVANLRDISDHERDIALVRDVVHGAIDDAVNPHRAPDEILDEMLTRYKQLYAEFKAQTDEEKQKVLSLGGLRIIGTERHDSRRIDNQLRGRAGRQGDVGSSVFYISAEDNLARIFGGERMQNLLERFNVPEDQPISVKMITNVIERAQRTAESRNYGARRNVLQYDDVMNMQRKLIYTDRYEILSDDEAVPAKIDEYAREVIAHIVDTYCDLSKPITDWDLDNMNRCIETELLPSLPTEEILNEDSLEGKTADDIADLLYDEYSTRLQRYHTELNAQLRTIVLDFIRSPIADLVRQFCDRHKEEGKWDIEGFNAYLTKNLLPSAQGDETIIPLETAENSTPEQLSDLIYAEFENRYDQLGENLQSAGGVFARGSAIRLNITTFLEMQRSCLLRTIDRQWTEHLDEMEALRDGIGLRSYGQVDPVVAYKKEGYDMFREMIYTIRHDVTANMSRMCQRLLPERLVLSTGASSKPAQQSNNKNRKPQPKIKRRR